MCGPQYQGFHSPCAPAFHSCCCGLEPTEEEKIEQLKNTKKFLEKKLKQVDASLEKLKK